MKLINIFSPDESQLILLSETHKTGIIFNKFERNIFVAHMKKCILLLNLTILSKYA